MHYTLHMQTAEQGILSIAHASELAYPTLDDATRAMECAHDAAEPDAWTVLLIDTLTETDDGLPDIVIMPLATALGELTAARIAQKLACERRKHEGINAVDYQPNDFKPVAVLRGRISVELDSAMLARKNERKGS